MPSIWVIYTGAYSGLHIVSTETLGCVPKPTINQKP